MRHNHLRCERLDANYVSMRTSSPQLRACNIRRTMVSFTCFRSVSTHCLSLVNQTASSPLFSYTDVIGRGGSSRPHVTQRIKCPADGWGRFTRLVTCLFICPNRTVLLQNAHIFFYSREQELFAGYHRTPSTLRPPSANSVRSPCGRSAR